MFKLLRLQRCVQPLTKPLFCTFQTTLSLRQQNNGLEFHDDHSKDDKPHKPKVIASSRYEVFRDEEMIVLDVEEEREKLNASSRAEIDYEIEESGQNAYAGLNLERK